MENRRHGGIPLLPKPTYPKLYWKEVGKVCMKKTFWYPSLLTGRKGEKLIFHTTSYQVTYLAVSTKYYLNMLG